MTQAEKELYKVLTEQILNNLPGAWTYANKHCGACQGKGYIERSQILKGGNFEVHPLRKPRKDKQGNVMTHIQRHTTLPQTELCYCTKRSLLKNVSE